jgi:hypothetical protein
VQEFQTDTDKAFHWSEPNPRKFPATPPAIEHVKTRITLHLDGFRVSQKWPQKTL